MKRPAFQFYPNDWRGNANLRRCSEAARGAWIDVLCLMHDSDEYGVLRWPLADIAQAAGLPIKLLQELARKSVLKGADGYAPAYEWAPSHAGVVGATVVLVATDAGPCWYCSRFVRDEFIRKRRGAQTRFAADPDPSPKAPPIPPIGEDIGGGFGDGPSASASSSTSKAKATAPSGADLLPDLPADLVRDFLAVRKAKKAALTPTAVRGIQREAAKAGLTLESAIRLCCERGWASFRADWNLGTTAPAATARRKEL